LSQVEIENRELKVFLEKTVLNLIHAAFEYGGSNRSRKNSSPTQLEKKTFTGQIPPSLHRRDSYTLWVSASHPLG